MVDNIINTRAPIVKETALVFNVINQAWLDASRKPTPKSSSGGSSAVTSQDHMEAIAFLTAENGEWAESRATLCDMVGINPEILRKKAIAMIEAANYEKA